MKHLQINILVPTLGLTGGVKVILEHANRLAQRGHAITLIYPYILPQQANIPTIVMGYLKKIRRKILHLAKYPEVDWFHVEPTIKIMRVMTLTASSIPNADITIATANETADWLNTYPDSKGKKFYLIQAYENWSRPIDLVDATWKMPLQKIVIASWMKDFAQKKFGENVAGVVLNGVDTTTFYCQNSSRPNNPIKVLMMYHKMPKKGIDDGLAAFQIAKQSHPNITLEMFGAYHLPPAIKKVVTNYYYRPSINLLRQLYSNADIFLWPSREEGFGLPPLEAMACGAAVLSTDTGAIRDYAVDNISTLIVPPNQPDLLAQKLIQLIDNSDLRLSLGQAASEMAKKFDWEESTTQLENILMRGQY